jgi:hypothetical protein
MDPAEKVLVERLFIIHCSNQAEAHLVGFLIGPGIGMTVNPGALSLRSKPFICNFPHLQLTYRINTSSVIQRKKYMIFELIDFNQTNVHRSSNNYYVINRYTNAFESRCSVNSWVDFNFQSYSNLSFAEKLDQPHKSVFSSATTIYTMGSPVINEEDEAIGIVYK